MVRVPTAANKYPQFVRYLVQRLRGLCPVMGKRNIAETPARAELHLGTTTLQRTSGAGVTKELRWHSRSRPAIDGAGRQAHRERLISAPRLARRPRGHPTASGVLDDAAPVCVAPAVAIFASGLLWLSIASPGARSVSRSPSGLRRPKMSAHAWAKRYLPWVTKPRYGITDNGKQCWCDEFGAWCRRRHIRPGLVRLASTGQSPPWNGSSHR